MTFCLFSVWMHRFSWKKIRISDEHTSSYICAFFHQNWWLWLCVNVRPGNTLKGVYKHRVSSSLSMLSSSLSMLSSPLGMLSTEQDANMYTLTLVLLRMSTVTLLWCQLFVIGITRSQLVTGKLHAGKSAGDRVWPLKIISLPHVANSGQVEVFQGTLQAYGILCQVISVPPC